MHATGRGAQESTSLMDTTSPVSVVNQKCRSRGGVSMVSMRCSSCAVGYVMTAFIMKRSICASGRLNVPSSSIGFCVAMTMNGFGSAMHWPPDGGGSFGHGFKHGRLGFCVER